MNFKSQILLLVFGLSLSACSLDQPEQEAPAPQMPAPVTPAPDRESAPAPAPDAEKMNLQQNIQTITTLDMESAPQPASEPEHNEPQPLSAPARHSIIADLNAGVFDSNQPARAAIMKLVDLPPLGQRFWMAASTATTIGDRLFFQKLMEDPDLWNEKDESGRGLVHVLAEKGKIRILKLLHYIELDRNFSQTDKYGRYPAHYASSQETIDYVWENTKVRAPGGRHFLSPATTLKDSEGKLPLHFLIDQRKTNAALILIDKLCSYSISAVFNGSGINSTDLLNRTPLHYAAITNNAAVTDALVNCGFTQRDAVDSAMRTPLHYAVQFPDFAAGYVITARAPKKQSGAEVMDREGKTPLDIAIEVKNEIATAILSRLGI